MTSRFAEAEMETLVYWIKQRDFIRARKEAGIPKPWTVDPLLRDYRWCNIRRMDDRVSVWLLEHWYDDRHDAEYQIFDAALARLINWPDSLEEILLERNPDDVEVILTARAARGDKVFTGAYIVPGETGKNKVESVCDLLQRMVELTTEAKTDKLINGSMREMWAWLMTFDGLGSFLAGQMAADLCLQGIGLYWPDRETWAPLGPGSARGMNRLLGRPKDAALKQDAFDSLLPELIAELRPRIEIAWRDRGLVAMDIQNCLCEFDKYRRLTLNEGTVRARYDGACATTQGSLI